MLPYNTRPSPHRLAGYPLAVGQLLAQLHQTSGGPVVGVLLASHVEKPLLLLRSLLGSDGCDKSSAVTLVGGLVAEWVVPRALGGVLCRWKTIFMSTHRQRTDFASRAKIPGVHSFAWISHA